MHLRKLVLACGFASFALSNYASALGLGEVKLKSTLNQPLSAEVQLLDTKGLSPEQIIVSLASSAEFERNGLDYVHFYTEFKFEVALDNPGGPVVRITSRNPVREPYLNFLVEAKWTSGRLLREYTLLMDLPTFDDAVPQPVQAAKIAPSKTASVTPSPQRSDVAAPVTQAAPDSQTPAVEEKPDIIAEQDQPAKKSKVAAGTYGPVGDKDTLWDIALAVRPDSNVSVHQTMLALQRLNPDAFIRGNINLLKKGQVLRVPDVAEASAISQPEAVRQFNNQVAEWSGAAANPGNTSLGAQLDASRRTSGERAKSEAVTGRVKLEAPGAKEKAGGGQGSGSNKGSGKALESELAATLEELDKAKSEKTELSSRVHDLEEQVKTMQRLVDVSNEKLRALQLNASKQPDKTPVADKKTADVNPADTVSADAKPANSQTATATTTTTTTTTTPVAGQANSSAAAVAPKKSVVKPAPQPEKTIVDQISDNILWVGLGALALLIAGAVAVTRRRKAQAEAEQNNITSDELDTEEPNFDSFNQGREEQLALEPSPDEMSLFDEEDTTAVAETGDVVGEADIYIAYGKFDQAEEMLVNGLAKDPGSTDIRLKLLEVYSQTQNASEFDRHYAALLPIAGALALSRAKELRANISNIGEFSPATAQAIQPEENLDLNEDFSLDDFDAGPTSTSATKSEDDFEFELDLDNNDELAADIDLGSSTTNYGMDFDEKSDSKNVVSLDDDFELDFDLDDTAAKHGEAEDLSDISLALDNLDDDGLPEDVEVSTRKEDDFNFDFDDLDDEPGSLAQEANAIAAAEVNVDETSGDDFNLEMDVNNVDLAALDNEMASLDAELDMLDDELPATPSNADNEFSALEDDELNLDSLDEDLAKLDSSFDAGDEFDENEFSLGDEDLANESFNATGLESNGLETENSDLEVSKVEGSTIESLDDSLELDEDEFSWEEDDVELEEPTDDLSLQDLDETLAAENLTSQESHEELGLGENAFAELDEHVSLDPEASEELLEEDLFEEDSLLAEDTLEESAPAIQEELARLDNIDEEAIEEIAETNAANHVIEDDLSDDDVFEQALSDFSAESLAMEDSANMSDDDMDAELDFMADADEAATKLDLARAYMDMGDNEGARDILAEVAHEGNDQQRSEAADLLSRIDA